MGPIFESTLPIFLLVVLGVVLKRVPLVDRSVWQGLEEIGYFVLFPALLFLTFYRADFSGLALGSIVAGCLVTVIGLFLVLVMALPLFRSRGISLAEFTTVLQTITRWNAFVALAIADKLFGESGLTLMALIMVIVVLPINFGNIALMVWYLSPSPNLGVFARRIWSNPLILACCAGLAMRFSGMTIYPSVEQAIDLVASAALGLGVIAVGAALRIRDTVRPRFISILCTFAKLLVYPLVATATCWAFGVRGEALVIIALYGCVPAAMNGYLLARQLGGDAPLYAMIATLQTAAAFLTIPLVLYLATYVASG